jgi:hypothetical protein
VDIYETLGIVVDESGEYHISRSRALLVYMCKRGSSDVQDRYQITGILVEARMSGAESGLRNGKGEQ